jgi:hypothetical protein
MQGKICGLLALVAVAGLASPVLGQFCNEDNSSFKVTNLKEPTRYILQPYSSECRNTSIRTASNKVIDTSEEIEFDAWDSKGRYLIELTNPGSGSSDYLVIDPVAGSRTVWNTGNNLATTLQFPTAVPGRKSCWQVPQVEGQWGTTKGRCNPAGHIQPPFCKSGGGTSTTNSTGALRVVEAGYEACRKTLSTNSLAAGILEDKEEDLGTKTIQGFETHGCRKTTKSATGTYIWEYWLAKLDSAAHSTGMTLRSVQDSQIIGNIEVKNVQEITNLRLEEPDPALFQVPDSYTTNIVEMQEVPCEQSIPHTVSSPEP